MEVRLTPDQEAFVRQAIESGRLHRAEDAVEEALGLWGRVIATEQDVRDLASDVKRRGRARLAAESLLLRQK
jgi:Arc/MetJ-type ribon-helix-helix transcriptional regulator